MLCHRDKQHRLLQRKKPTSRHMVQCIAVDIDIWQVELEWGSLQEEALPNHLLYRSSETESSLSACVCSKGGLIQSAVKIERSHTMFMECKFIWVWYETHTESGVWEEVTSLYLDHTHTCVHIHNTIHTCINTHICSPKHPNSTNRQPQAKEHKATLLLHAPTETESKPASTFSTAGCIS